MPPPHLHWIIAEPYFQVHRGESIESLQMAQNAAARCADHIAPILATVHWLQIHVSSDFKVLLLTQPCPAAQVGSLTTYTPSHASRFQNSGLLAVQRVKKKSAGCRAFLHRAPFL